MNQTINVSLALMDASHVQMVNHVIFALQDNFLMERNALSAKSTVLNAKNFQANVLTAKGIQLMIQTLKHANFHVKVSNMKTERFAKTAKIIATNVLVTITAKNVR